MYIQKLQLFLPALILRFKLLSCVHCLEFPSADDFKIRTGVPQYCGKLDVVPTDIRSFAPWAVAIYRRVNSSNHRWKFHSTGSIFSPGHVWSNQVGPPGRFPIDKDPENFLIVAGVNTTDFSKHDQFAQYFRVKFILQHKTYGTLESFYHYAIYFLEKTLDFSTPFVKAICLPTYFADPKNQFSKNIQNALKTGKFSIPTPVYGFASGGSKYRNEMKNKITKKREWTLKVWKMLLLPLDVCDAIFRLYYGRTYGSPFCERKTFSNASSFYSGDQILRRMRISPEYGQNDDELCFSHGSRALTYLGGTWFAASAVSLIPGRKWNRCNSKTVYITSNNTRDEHEYVQVITWGTKLEKCGNRKFPCASLNSTKCIPLHRTCDKKVDCEDGSDEHPDVCTGKARGQEESSKEVDSVEGTMTESGDLDLDPRYVFGRCPDFHFVLDGMRCLDSETLEDVSCTFPFYYGRRIRVECDHFYTATKYGYDHMDLFCNFDGEWVGYRPIYCHKDCGVFDESLNTNFPWGMVIFDDGVESCGGTLIQPSFVLTDGRCVQKWIESYADRSTIQVSLAEDFALVKENATKFLVKNLWIISAKDARDSADKYENGVALVQLLEPVKQNVNDMNLMMAACFLVPPFNEMQSEQVAMIGNGNIVEVSSKGCEDLKNEGFFCTTSPLDPDNQTAENSNGAIKLGAGIFLRRVESNTGKSKHVLKGIFSGATKDGRGTFKNVDYHAERILDILEANS